jgi:hypothetical protein
LRPDFKLAHLIRGDLLMARARPISGLGGGPKANKQSLTICARKRACGCCAISTNRARPVAAPDTATCADQKYALLADTSRARLYLFENINGEPHLKADFYMTIGKNGTDKRVEGDKRTPMGVYQITEQLPRASLADLYGDGAFPLNYPNEWDRLHKRGGHGIWLHGVPSNTYSRPPRSSDGCVVVANPDLKELLALDQGRQHAGHHHRTNRLDVQQKNGSAAAMTCSGGCMPGARTGKRAIPTVFCALQRR